MWLQLERSRQLAGLELVVLGFAVVKPIEVVVHA